MINLQGVHLILCFFEDYRIYSRLWFHRCFYWPFTAFPRCQCVYTEINARSARWQVDRSPAELAEFRKSQHFEAGKTKYLLNTLYFNCYFQNIHCVCLTQKAKQNFTIVTKCFNQRLLKLDLE